MEMSDGVPIWYIDQGSRESSTALVLIHGDPMSSRFWAKNLPALSKRWRIVATDIRGRGESAKVEAGHNLARYAADLLEVITRLQLTRVVAVGWSIGAFVVFQCLREMRDARIAGLVNVDQPAAWLGSDEDLKRREEFVRSRRMASTRDHVRRLIGPTAVQDEATIDWMAAEMLKTPPSCQLPAMRDAYWADFRPFLSGVQIPCLVLFGKHGLVVPESQQFLRQAMPSARFVVFDRSGHLLPWTEARKFNSELERFATTVLR